jgi:hypothetical protein
MLWGNSLLGVPRPNSQGEHILQRAGGPHARLGLNYQPVTGRTEIGPLGAKQLDQGVSRAGVQAGQDS